MSYQKQAWRDYDDTKTELQNMQNGAVVTPERLNHIETGIANSADKQEVATQLAHLADEVFSIEHGGSTIQTEINSFDSYFSSSEHDPNKVYYLDETKVDATSRYLTKRKPKLLGVQGVLQPDKGFPVTNGLKIWVDSAYKRNSDVSKNVFNDLSGEGNNGELEGFSFNNESGWNDGLLFDGVDDKVIFNNVNFGVNGCSFEVVFFVPEEGFPVGPKLINSNSSNISLWKEANSRYSFKFYSYERPRIDTALVKLNTYNHITCTVDFATGDIKLYLNGVLVDTATNSPISLSSAITLYLGSFNIANNMVGKQKSFRYYDRPLTTEEVARNYNYENQIESDYNNGGSSNVFKDSETGKTYKYWLSLEGGNLKFNIEEVI